MGGGWANGASHAWGGYVWEKRRAGNEWVALKEGARLDVKRVLVPGGRRFASVPPTIA